MPPRRYLTHFLLLLLAAASIGLLLMFMLVAAAAGADAPAGFTNPYEKVDAVFFRHCVECHGAVEPEAGLVLENFDSLMLGSDNGPVLKPGHSSESLLLEMVEGRGPKKKIMPPGKREKLMAEEIETIKQWIDAGAPAPPKGFVAIRELSVPKIEPIGPPRRPVNAIAVEPRAKLAAIGRYREVELLSTSEMEVVKTLSGSRGNVNALAFSPSGRELFAAAGENVLFGEVREYGIPGGELLKTFEGHHDAIFSVAVSPDGKTLATGSYDQKIKLWDIARGRELRTLSGHNGAVFGLAFRPDGKVLASASSDRTVKLWDTATGARLDTLSQSLKELNAVAFSPDGKRLAAAGGDNRVRVWEVSQDARETPAPIISRFAHEGAILRLAYSTDGKWILTSAQDQTVKLWDAANVEEKLLFEKQPDWPSAIAFGPGNENVLVGRLDGTLSVYDTMTGAVSKPPAPRLSSLEPRGVQRGVKTRVRLSGSLLSRVKSAQSADGKLAASLTSPDPTGSEAWIELDPPRNLPRGSYQVAVSNSNGQSGWLSLWVDELPQFQMAGAEAEELEIPALPAMVWGTIAKQGESKIIAFSARAGETVVFDPETQAIGSKARLNLALEDEAGRLLAHSEGFEGKGAPLLVHSFKNSGEFRLVLTESMLEASKDHYFRVALGAFPCVTGFFPLGVAAGATSHVQLVGYNLPAGSAVTVHPSDTGEIDLPLNPEIYRARPLAKLLVTREHELSEAEPNDQPSQANPIPVPSVVNGRIWAKNGGTDADFFQFHARGGERLVLETSAARRGSPVDTKIEVLHKDGQPVHRVMLQAVRDSHITFRGFDSNANDARLESWEEMDLDQYLYMEGEVCRLFRAPLGPDSGYGFYELGGKRRTYFGTSSIAHAFDEICYIVEPRPPNSKALANGLPVFTIDFVNDDDDERGLGSDSRIVFTAPAEDDYLVRVSDSRNLQGEEFAYRLTLREAKPDFKVSMEGANPSVPPGSGAGFSLKARRIDGFEGEIRAEISGLPPGFLVSTPLVIQAGQLEAKGVLYAMPEARWPEGKNRPEIKVAVSAMVEGALVSKPVESLGTIKRGGKPKVRVALEPDVPLDTDELEITIAPGETIPARIKVEREGFDDLLTFSVENLPHGVIVDNIGLSGVMIPKGQDERQIFLTAAKWVPETDRLCHAVENQAGRQTSAPVLLHVRKKGMGKPAPAAASNAGREAPAER